MSPNRDTDRLRGAGTLTTSFSRAAKNIAAALVPFPALRITWSAIRAAITLICCLGSVGIGRLHRHVRRVDQFAVDRPQLSPGNRLSPSHHVVVVGQLKRFVRRHDSVVLGGS